MRVCGIRSTTGHCDEMPAWNKIDEWGTNASQWKTTHPWTGVTYFSLLEFPDKPIPEEPQDTLHVQSDEGFVS